MALFRQNLNSGMNFLRRHFSSDDLYQDRDDDNVLTSASGSATDSYRMNLVLTTSRQLGVSKITCFMSSGTLIEP